MKMYTLLIIPFVSSAYADLVPMTDIDLQSSTGAGLGFFLEDFVLKSNDGINDPDASNLAITGIGGSNGQPITVNWTELYILGEGSNNGTIITSTDVGSYNHPWVIRTARGSADWDPAGGRSANYGATYGAIGDDIALIEFATDIYTSRAQNTNQFVKECVIQNLPGCSGDRSLRRPGTDIGSRFEVVLPSRTDYFDFDVKGLYIDGSSLRLWSRPEDGINGNGQNELSGNVKLSIYAKQITMDVCQNGCNATNELRIDDFFLDLNLGNGEVQPLKFSSTADGNFVFQIGLDPDENTFKGGLDPRPEGVDVNSASAMKAFYDNFYANADKSNIYIGNVQVGNSSIGKTTVENFSFHYLKTTSKDL